MSAGPTCGRPGAPESVLVPVSSELLVDLDDGRRVEVEWDGGVVARLRTVQLVLTPVR